MPEPVLEFLRNDAGEKEGLGEAGIETFRDTPYASCAREAGQNSLDAAASLPVRVTFNVFQLSREEFPAWDQLSESVRACRAAVASEKEKDFFDNAARVVEAESMSVLEIADYNTRGLTGPPDREGTPFHSLLKGTGVSSKESETAGGSFGIGKNASFAVSDLQMVLYSTQYAREDGGEEHAAQGKIKLVSHLDAENVPRRMTGYWGDASFRAITNPERIPHWMRRRDPGTSIYCLGFRESQNWAELITASLVTNFFAAVHAEKMEFEVAGRFRINRNTIAGLLENQSIRTAAEEAGHLSDLDFSQQLYRCLVSPRAELSVLEIDGLGSVEIRVLMEPRLPKRVAFIRNGMFITDNLQHFGHRFARFPSSRDFVALVEPFDSASRKLFKHLENPAHRELSAQRILDPLKRSAADRAMKALGKRLRDLIRNSTSVQVAGTVVIDELAKFFADPGVSDRLPDENAEGNPEIHTFTPPRVNPRKPVRPARPPGDEGGRGGSESGSSGTGGGIGVGVGNGSGGRGTKGTDLPVQLREVRNVLANDDEGTARSRLIRFTPASDGEIRLSVYATGLNSPEPLIVSTTDTGTVVDGDVILTARAGERQSILLTFLESYSGPVEILATDAEEVSA